MVHQKSLMTEEKKNKVWIKRKFRFTFTSSNIPFPWITGRTSKQSVYLIQRVVSFSGQETSAIQTLGTVQHLTGTLHVRNSRTCSDLSKDTSFIWILAHHPDSPPTVPAKLLYMGTQKVGKL